ncbi:MAG TPA: ROK family protein [Chroococcidiopsis sp.]
MFRCGLDLGGTKIEGIVLDASGRILFRDRLATQRDLGYEHILGRVKSLYDQMVAQIEGADHSLGIGTPGAISPKTGLLKNSNTLCLNHKPLHQDLERCLQHPIAIHNDANCFAIAEALQGAGRGHELVFGVIMGTGCGGGIVYRGEVLAGRRAIAGEWGHSSIDPNGPQCWCGQRGCVETLISGGGLEQRYADRGGDRPPLTEIVQRYRQGEPNAVAVMQAFFRHFGRSLANVINILDPDLVVLGGGVSNIDELYSLGVAAVANCVFSDGFETPSVQHQLGDSAGVIGAALVGI